MLGQYVFSLHSAGYRSQSTDAPYRWAYVDVVGAAPVPQYLGPGLKKQSLKGALYPELTGGLEQIDAMNAEAGQGTPLLLVFSSGIVGGYWCIDAIQHEATKHNRHGDPQEISFTVNLSQGAQ